MRCGFDKQKRRALQSTDWRAGWVPVGVNPIFLHVYPNPFNPTTQVEFTIPDVDANDIAEVKVYDMDAKDVSTLVHEIEPAGRRTAKFDASQLPAGAYIVAVHLATHQQSKMIILQK